MIITLTEQLTYDQANLITEAVTNSDGNKDLCLKGIFIQGDVRNQNQRVYPVNEITNAVKSIQEKIKEGYSVLGEADHPDDLQVNLDRVSHIVTEMAMNENNTKRLKTMEKNVAEGLGLVADYKPNRISFYILLLASGRTEQLRDVLYKDMEKYRVKE